MAINKMQKIMVTTVSFLSIILLSVIFLEYDHSPTNTKSISLKSTAVYESQLPDYFNDGNGGRFNALDTALFVAVFVNDVLAAQKALSEGANVNALAFHDQPHYGQSPLFFAIQRNSLEMAKLLIKAGANINEWANTGGISDKEYDRPQADSRNNTLLSYAVIMNNPEMVKLLIASGADVNKRGPIKTNWTPLAIARYNKRDAIEKILLEAGAQ